MEFSNRYYYDDNGNVLYSEYSNVIKNNYKFVEDNNEYDLKKIKIVDKKIINKTEEELNKEEKDLYDSLNYKIKRMSKYPYESDQLDAIYKGFEAIKGTITLPQETLDWLAKCKKVKEDIPKT